MKIYVVVHNEYDCEDSRMYVTNIYASCNKEIAIEKMLEKYDKNSKTVLVEVEVWENGIIIGMIEADKEFYPTEIAPWNKREGEITVIIPLVREGYKKKVIPESNKFTSITK